MNQSFQPIISVASGLLIFLILFAGCAEQVAPPSPVPTKTQIPTVAASPAPAASSTKKPAPPKISFPLVGNYGEDYNDLIAREIQHSKIRSLKLEGSGSFGKIILQAADGQLLYLEGEYETHPDDTELSKLKARRRPVLKQAPESAFDSSPDQDLGSYYEAISEDRIKDAFQMRSSRSRKKTSYEEFAATWSNNEVVLIEQNLGSSEAGNQATVRGILRSKDLNESGSPETALFNFSVKMVREGKHWRYDGGDFSKVEPIPGHPAGIGGPPIQTDPAVIDPEGFVSYRSAGVAVIAPSSENRGVARELLRHFKVSEVPPQKAVGVLVVLSTISASDPLDMSYESYSELSKESESSGYISGTIHHVYLYRINDDSTVTQLDHKSFDSSN